MPTVPGAAGTSVSSVAKCRRHGHRQRFPSVSRVPVRDDPATLAVRAQHVIHFSSSRLRSACHAVVSSTVVFCARRRPPPTLVAASAGALSSIQQRHGDARALAGGRESLPAGVLVAQRGWLWREARCHCQLVQAHQWQVQPSLCNFIVRAQLWTGVLSC